MEIPRKKWGNPQLARGITGTHLFPLLIFSEPLWLLQSHAILLFCPTALPYTFILEKPQVDMEVQLQSTILHTHRGDFLHQRIE